MIRSCSNNFKAYGSIETPTRSAESGSKEEEEEESLFKADEVNEEDPDRRRRRKVYSKLTQ